MLLDGPPQAQAHGAAESQRRRVNGGARGGCEVTRVVMPWLVATDVQSARGFARIGRPDEAELRRRALQAPAELVRADVPTWDRVRALAGDPRPESAVVLFDRKGEIARSSPDAVRRLAEHFGAGEHPAWLPRPVAAWLARPRPPLVSEREGRRLTVWLVPGDPYALLLEETVASPS